VNGYRVSIRQEAAKCAFGIVPLTLSVAADGETRSVTVTTGSGCAWTATSHAAWITITSGATGAGSGSVALTVATNTGAARIGAVTIAGQTVTLTQVAPGECAYTIAPVSQSIGATGGAGTSITVSTEAKCAWTSTSNAAWLTITSGASGKGPGTVAFSVAANAGADRTATLTIAGQPFTVTQASGCAYTIAPQNESFGASGGTDTVAVTTTAGCAWTAASNAPAWLTITSGASGTGSETVTFTVGANTGADRTGTLTVAGQTFTVIQAAAPPPPCAYTIDNPPSQQFGALGGMGSVTVMTTAGCAWTAASNEAWLTITSGPGGTGDGSVDYTVDPFIGGVTPRSGTLTIAGQSFTVNQSEMP
jgi:hypothetical protein